MSTTTTRRSVVKVETGNVTVIAGPTSDREQRPARRNTYSDGTTAVIYASTSRRVAPSVAATFAPEVELTDSFTLANQNEQAEAEDAPLDTTLAKAVNEALCQPAAERSPEAEAEAIIVAEAERLGMVTGRAAPVKHRIRWFDYRDGAKVPHAGGLRRRGDIISVECSCGAASPTATRKEIDGWVAEHKRPA
jgi:hypothetical protein